MIARLLELLLRVLVETAMILLVIAALLGVLSWRVARRLVTSRPGRFDATSEQVGRALRFAAAFAPAASRPDGGDGVVDSEP